MKLLGDAAWFTPAHYEKHRGVAPAYLAELVVHCLELVAQLSASGLAFRFKGGNSQLVLLDRPTRFSIDVDIVTTVPREELTAVVERIAAEHPRFTACEVRPHRTKPWLPILSFKVFFDSQCGRSAEDSFVILDAVLEPPAYPGTTKRIACGDLFTCDQTVELPTISGLLADKMLCISPKTVGIPLGKNKDAHRLKHVFDVANLSRHAPSYDEVMSALATCLAQENEIQKSAWTLADVSEDTKAFCRGPLAHSDAPAWESFEPGDYMLEIARGFPEVGSFLFARQYDWSVFQEDCRQVIQVFERVDREIG